jgi:hypothetical protein
MLSIQELKLLKDKIKRIKKENWKEYIENFEKLLEDLIQTVDGYNQAQIQVYKKSKTWFEKDLEWRENHKEFIIDELFTKTVCSKINQFGKMGQHANTASALEIGPGYGRFTRNLSIWRTIYCLDILDSIVPKVLEKFNPRHHKFVKFFKSNGTGCADIPSGSCHFVFSWDTFTFFDNQMIKDYMQEIKRISIPGGYSLIHYADCDFDYDLHEAKRGYWEFNTQSLMRQTIEQSGLKVIEMSQIRPGANYVIFQKPGNANPVLYKTLEIPVEN